MTRMPARRRALTATVAAALLVAGSLAIASPALADDELEPLPVGTASISGTPKAGEVLTVTTDGWPADTVLSYQWSYNGGEWGGPIEGETEPTYTVTSDLVGLWVGVLVTGHLDGYEDSWVNAGLDDIVFADQLPAAPAPVADSAGLGAYLSGAGATGHTAQEAGLPAEPLDPATGYTANLAWGPGDSFVDVYLYSAPVFLGTFPVSGGAVQVPLDASVLGNLGAGTHTLVAIGQTSGSVHGVGFSLAAVLASTGSDAVPFALVGGVLLLGGVVLVLRRRRVAQQ
jgi:LPXTG-motif cell wall-anchored protein